MLSLESHTYLGMAQGLYSKLEGNIEEGDEEMKKR